MADQTRAGYKAVTKEEAESYYGYTGAGGAGDSAYLSANSGTQLPGHNMRWVPDAPAAPAPAAAPATAPPPPVPGPSSGMSSGSRIDMPGATAAPTPQVPLGGSDSPAAGFHGAAPGSLNMRLGSEIPRASMSALAGMGKIY